VELNDERIEIGGDDDETEVGDSEYILVMMLSKQDYM